MSNSSVKNLFTILISALFISSCGQPAAAELPIVTAASTSLQAATPPIEQLPPTSQPSAAFPTEKVSPTPTDQPFVLPGGRLLLAAIANSEVRNTDPYFPWFNQYFWLQLPDMTLEANSYLIGNYPVRDEVVTLSPDFSNLAFGRETYTQSGDNLYSGVSVSVLLANPDDDEVTPIGQPFSGDAVSHRLARGDDISWSANSQVFAFARSLDWGNYENEHHLYVYDDASGNFTTLMIQTSQPSSFALSPDGTQIAFTHFGTSPGLSLINVDGSNQQLLVEGWVSSNLVWQLDGKRIFFIQDKPKYAIYSVDVSTGATAPLTVTSDQAGLLSLSPDGSFLAYEDSGINVVSSNGGDPIRLTRGIGTYEWVWSADSQYIAYISTVEESIFVMDRLGNGKVRVYHEDKMTPVQLIGWLP
jgi:hypothetical protein